VHHLTAHRVLCSLLYSLLPIKACRAIQQHSPYPLPVLAVVALPCTSLCTSLPLRPLCPVCSAGSFLSACLSLPAGPPLYVFVCYFPPPLPARRRCGLPSLEPSVFDSLLAALDALPSCCSVVMLGDFNARTASALPVSPGAAHGLSYPWPCRLSLDPCSNPRGRVLLSLCSSYLLAIANGSASGNSSSLPSRCDGTPSVVDYALLSYDLCAHSSLSIFPPFADSDHVPSLSRLPYPCSFPLFPAGSLSLTPASA